MRDDGEAAVPEDDEADGTGDARVDEAIAALDGLPGRPPDEHVAVFEDIHGKLRQVLSELDTDSGSPGDGS